MTDSLETTVRRMVWREHAKGPGVATFEYGDGGHDHRDMSPYEARTVADGLGLVAVRQRPEFQEWVGQ
jgi:hypothetical protein